jgi:hypothetical protein
MTRYEEQHDLRTIPDVARVIDRYYRETRKWRRRFYALAAISAALVLAWLASR